jgi:hypothetical protein
MWTGYCKVSITATILCQLHYVQCWGVQLPCYVGTSAWQLGAGNICTLHLLYDAMHSTCVTAQHCHTSCNKLHCHTPCTKLHCHTPRTNLHCHTPCTNLHCHTPCTNLHCHTPCNTTTMCTSTLYPFTLTVPPLHRTISRTAGDVK